MHSVPNQPVSARCACQINTRIKFVNQQLYDPSRTITFQIHQYYVDVRQFRGLREFQFFNSGVLASFSMLFSYMASYCRVGLIQTVCSVHVGSSIPECVWHTESTEFLQCSFCSIHLHVSLFSSMVACS